MTLSDTTPTLARIGRIAARRVGRKRTFSSAYVHRVLAGQRGNLDGKNARMIREVAKTLGRKSAS